MRLFKLPITHSYPLTFYFFELFHNCVNCFRRTSRGSKLAPEYYTVIHKYVTLASVLYFLYFMILTQFRWHICFTPQTEWVLAFIIKLWQYNSLSFVFLFRQFPIVVPPISNTHNGHFLLDPPHILWSDVVTHIRWTGTPKQTVRKICTQFIHFLHSWCRIILLLIYCPVYWSLYSIYFRANEKFFQAGTKGETKLSCSLFEVET